MAGENLFEYPLTGKTLPIQVSPAYEEEMARIFAGYDRDTYLALPGNPRWVDPDDPKQSKAEVITLYRIHERIQTLAMQPRK